MKTFMKIVLPGLIAIALAIGHTSDASQGIKRLPSSSQSFRDSGMLYAFQGINPAADGTTDIHSAYAGSAADTVSFFPTSTESNLLHSSAHPYGRSVALTVGGTSGSINAGTVTLYGYNCLREQISQTYTIQEDTGETIQGTKAFWSVYRLATNQQDGSGVTFSLGFGSLIGMPFTSPINPVLGAWSAGTREATAPTVTFDKTDVELNTINPSTAFNGTNDWVYLLWIPPYGAITSAGSWW